MHQEGWSMLLTIFLAIVFCAAITLMLLSAVAFGARIFGWTLMAFSILMILGIGIVSIWDVFRNGFGFWQFFTRFVLIFTIYKVYDMVCFDYFLLMKFHFFQYYFPEVGSVYPLKKYGYNIKSQLLKLLVIFPAASAIAAWVCTLFQ